MKKKVFLLSGLMALTLTLGLANGLTHSIVGVQASGTVNLGVQTPDKITNAGNANGFYISMKVANDLPYDPGWSFTSFTTSNKCYLNDTPFNVRIKKLETNNYYVCLSDDGAQASAAGDIFILEGDYTYTHTDGTVYNYSIANTRYKFDGSKWLKDIYFDDSQLATYDCITLKDTGIPDATSEATHDFQGGDINGVNTFAASEGNTTGSLIFSFLYSQDQNKNSNTIDFRFRGTPNLWDGYRFQLNSSWGPEGVCVLRTSDTNAVSGDILIKLCGVQDSLIQFGLINIKDTDNLWAFVKQDGVTLYSDVITANPGWNNPTAGVYIVGGGKTAVQTFKSVDQDYNNVIHSGKVTIMPNSDSKGLFLDIEANDGVPYYEDWSKVINIMDNSTVTINGKKVFGDRAGVLKKYGPISYYLMFLDNGYTAKANDLVIFEGTFAYWDSDNNRCYKLSFASMACMFDGAKWTEVTNFLQTLADSMITAVDLEMYDEKGSAEINKIIEEQEPKILNASSFNEALNIYNQAVALLNEVEQDPIYAAAKLAQAKEDACLELDSYPNPENYSEDNWNRILDIIAQAKANINSASKVAEVKVALANAKAAIDAVDTIEKEIIEHVKNRDSGYEEYLEAYDVTSLSSFNYEELEFKSFKSSDSPETIYNDGPTPTEHNTYSHSEDNVTSSMIFQFVYNINTLTSGYYGAIFIRLRGVPYFGYRFKFATNTGGYGIDRFESDTNYKDIANVSNVFEVNKDYNVQCGAIDIVGTDKVWLFVTVDGNMLTSEVTDKISFCTNYRMGIADSFMAADTNDIALLKEYGQGVTTNEPAVNLNRVHPFEGQSDMSKGIYFRSEDAIPFTSDWSLNAYPMSKDAVTLNGEPICSLDKGIIKKFNHDEYYVTLEDNGVAINDGDVVVIDGNFSTMDPADGSKINFTIKKSAMEYHAPDSDHPYGYWEYVADLEEVKADAIESLNTAVDLDNYNDENRATIEGIIATAIADINNATDKETVNDILNRANAQIATIHTLLDDYIDLIYSEFMKQVESILDDYRDEQKDEIREIIANLERDLRACTSKEAVDNLINSIIAEIDKVKTDAQLKEQELNDARSAAKNEIIEYYGEINLDAYDDENIEKINGYVQAAMSAIDSVESIEEIQGIIDNLKANIAGVPTKNNDHSSVVDNSSNSSDEPRGNGGCGGSIISTCALVSIISALGIAVFARKRKED